MPTSASPPAPSEEPKGDQHQLETNALADRMGWAVKRGSSGLAIWSGSWLLAPFCSGVGQALAIFAPPLPKLPDTEAEAMAADAERVLLRLARAMERRGHIPHATGDDHAG